MPNGNGTNGNGRDPKTGKFLKGNPGGPGNPYTTTVARLRNVMLQAVTDDDIRAITRKLVWLAVEKGNVHAAREILDRLLGKPKVTMEVQERPPDEDPFAVLRDEEVTGALDRALARLSTGGSVAEPGGSSN